MTSIAVDVVVTGHVQGVFFRASMREQAGPLGVTGWVRNEPDGSVHAHLEGPAEAVESLVEWCAAGPPSAQVDERRADRRGSRPVQRISEPASSGFHFVRFMYKRPESYDSVCLTRWTIGVQR